MSASARKHESGSVEATQLEPTDRPGSPEDELPIPRSHHRGGVVALRPSGPLDASGIEQLQEAVSEAEAPVVVDLDECILLDPAALGSVHADIPVDPADVSIACRRLSCRVLLARAGITERFAVFSRIEDAVQARILWQAGYGEGWSPR
jgi:hypothetical protein